MKNMDKKYRIVFLGNFDVSYTSETHHANSLETLGHEVIRLREGKTTGEEVYRQAVESDLLVVVHTHGWVTPGLPLSSVLERLKGVTPSVTYHLDLWLGLEREKDLTSDSFYNTIDYFFATDKLMSDWFNENTRVCGVFLPPGVYDKEAYLSDVYNSSEFKHDIVFTGSRGYHPEWKYRQQLIDWLRANYGERFEHYGNDGKRVVRGAELNDLYASTKIVIGDSLNIGFKYPYYTSDRLTETTGRGAFVIYPYIKGIEDMFVLNKELVTYEYGDFEGLQKLIDYYLEHDESRERIRLAGHERAKSDHTYLSRWSSILERLEADGVL